MALFWFLAGAVTTCAALIIAIPWLRKLPRLGSLPLLPWQASLGAAVAVIAVIGSSHWLGRSAIATPSGALGSTNVPAGAFGNAVQVFDRANEAPATGAGSMQNAIASLEARLTQGGGSAADWELLAKAFEFIGRPADAAKARLHRLPAWNAKAGGTAANTAGGSGAVVTGEIDLAAPLARKAEAGETLFIFAKSVATPGPPVAVYRSRVGRWPLQFRLDDSQSMMPGRNLSSAGRVTIEARISRSGQPLPAAGDLEGSTGAINPADHKPLKILIDRIVS